MAGLLLRLLGYAVVAVGIRRLWAPFWRRYRARIGLALRVALIVWVVLAVLRLLLQPHTPAEWWTAALVFAGFGVLYGAVWLVTRLLLKRRS